MSPIEAFVLGIVQGLTEFAPVSSSAHLVLVPWLLRWPEPSLAFDTTLHLGTLLAVVAFFAGDLLRLATAWAGSLRPPFRVSEEAGVAWLLVLATIPAALAGFFLQSWFEKLFNSPVSVGAFLVVTALLLTLADYWGLRREPGYPKSAWQALVIGVMQAVAIAPGISRSGATISAGMLVGLSRTAAARFSFLLSVPIILGAGANQLLHLARQGQLVAQEPALFVGFLAAAATGYLCIRLLLSYLGAHSLRVFAGYCLLLGVFAVVVSTIGR
ncbi:MAG: undecaprenyl-diphosphatase UppP [Actinobacteria bacterium]|nr:undecaprenyl-diphosphatase UppP [Actinomycetota bacterium]